MFILCASILWLIHSSACLRLENESITISTKESVHVVDKRFLSIAIDTHLIQKHWENFNFSSERLYTLASGLQPAYLRIGGTYGDFVIFDENRDVSTVNEPITEDLYENYKDDGISFQTKNFANFIMTGEDLDKIHKLASRAGWDVVFGLNLLLRRRDNGEWNSSNPLKILRYVSEKRYNFAWELGNEPNHFRKFNITITPKQIGNDFNTLRDILNENPSFGSTLVGPDANRVEHAENFLKEFLSTGGEAVDAVTWHQYYMNGRNATIEHFYRVKTLDSLFEDLSDVNDVLATSAPRLKGWMGETSSAYGGGAANLSDRFVAGFMWLDKLGLAARFNQDIVIRQTFFGGRYALIGFDLLPNPDYWLSLLYKRLVGPEVLEVQKGLEMGRDLRVYAHCTSQQLGRYSSGAVTVIALNVNPSKQATFSLTGDLQGLKVDQYLLTPDNDDLTSRSVRLNGKILQLIDDNTLPDLPPKQVSSDNLVVPPLTFGYFVVSAAAAEACTNVKS